MKYQTSNYIKLPVTVF